ncbi:MAG: osmoprotectant transport system ATP-binding protein [Candidatus Binatia bacterium]
MPRPDSSTAVLQLRQVAKRRGRANAADGIDLEIFEGTTTVLVGPSGCGKSTLLALMIGLLTPDSGTVEFEGTILDTVTAGTLRRRMGYVVQDGGLFPHLSARSNVTLMAERTGWSAPRITERLTELGEALELSTELLRRHPGQLSGGQRQRVALMRALMLDPDLLLLDEPLGALDPMIRAELQDHLSALFQRLKKTVVLVTHDLAEAALFADSIVLMRDGRIEQRGTLTDLRERPASEFVTKFVAAQRSLPGGSVG